MQILHNKKSPNVSLHHERRQLHISRSEISKAVMQLALPAKATYPLVKVTLGGE